MLERRVSLPAAYPPFGGLSRSAGDRNSQPSAHEEKRAHPVGYGQVGTYRRQIPLFFSLYEANRI